MSASGKSVPLAVDEGRHRLLRGFLEGLSAASLFVAGSLPHPRLPRASIASDWQAVGNDLRHATLKYAKKTAA